MNHGPNRQNARTRIFGPASNSEFPGKSCPQGRRRQLVVSEHDRRRKARHDGIKAFSETDFTEELNVMTVPT
jgi:hypothetical protein